MKQFLASLSSVNKLLIFLLVLTLAALGYVLFRYQSQADRGFSYSAVFMNTGDLYFGQLHYLPLPSLTDVYLLQRNPNDTQTPLSLVKFTNVVWGPSDRLWLNPKEIVWTTALDAQSQVLQAIRAMKARGAAPSSVGAPQDSSAPAVATSTKK